MKFLYSLLVAAFLMVGFSADAQSGLTLNENGASVVIDGNTTRMDLIQIRATLLENGIDFKYSFQFNAETRLQSIDFTVTANDGNISSAGVHNSLQSEGAKVSFVVNKTSGTCTVNIIE